MTPAQRSIAGRIGSAIARSRHPAADLTAAARASFLERFERAVREESPGLPDAEIQRRSGELRRAHMLQLSLRSSIARGKRKGASSDQRADAPEVDGASHHTATPRS